MAKSDLLKEAIADAKAVKETALANAKIALEEAFAPRIQNILTTKISEAERSVIVSLPASILKVSEPAPPVMMSSPAPPCKVSFPSPP